MEVSRRTLVAIVILFIDWRWKDHLESMEMRLSLSPMGSASYASPARAAQRDLATLSSRLTAVNFQYMYICSKAGIHGIQFVQL